MTRSRTVAWTLFAVSTTFALASVPLIVANRDGPSVGYGHFSIGLALVAVMLSLPMVGTIVTARQPKNVVGWILLCVAVSFGLSTFANEYAVHAHFTDPGSLPGGEFMAWAASSTWVPGYGLLVALFLVFPTGRLPSARWRPALVALAFAVVALTIGYSFRPGPLSPPLDHLANPYAPSGILGEAISWLHGMGSSISVLMLMAGAASLLLRFRRARGVERQQLKWLVYAASLLAAYLLLALIFVWLRPVSELPLPLYLTGILLFNLIPIATGIAILRYRLYDIDLLINRTLVYGATSAALAVTFWAGIVVLQTLLRPLTGGSELAVAASTLVSFGLFQPVRRRIQDAVDRRFNRSRYNAARALDAFADRVRDEVDLDALRAHLLRVVNRTVAPSHASLWLRSDHATKELATPRL